MKEYLCSFSIELSGTGKVTITHHCRCWIALGKLELCILRKPSGYLNLE
jgi:hypothetical protein